MARGTGYYFGTPAYRLPADPLNFNRNRAMGGLLNPFGEALISKSPMPLVEPIGYMAGLYNKDNKFGRSMSKFHDPIGIFSGGLLGRLF